MQEIDRVCEDLIELCEKTWFSGDYPEVWHKMADKILSLKISGTTLKELIKWYLTLTDGEFLEERQISRLEKHLGITTEELLEKLDETGGELAIVEKPPMEPSPIYQTVEVKQVIWQGGQE